MGAYKTKTIIVGLPRREVFDILEQHNKGPCGKEGAHCPMKLRTVLLKSDISILDMNIL